MHIYKLWHNHSSRNIHDNTIKPSNVNECRKRLVSFFLTETVVVIPNDVACNAAFTRAKNDGPTGMKVTWGCTGNVRMWRWRVDVKMTWGCLTDLCIVQLLDASVYLVISFSVHFRLIELSLLYFYYSWWFDRWFLNFFLNLLLTSQKSFFEFRSNFSVFPS